jgi:hypothetical protein
LKISNKVIESLWVARENCVRPMPELLLRFFSSAMAPFLRDQMLWHGFVEENAARCDGLADYSTALNH